MFPKVTFAVPPELCAESLQKPDLRGPCPCCTVLLWNYEWRNLHIFKVTSLRICYAFGSLNQRGNITNLCNHPTTHPNSVILATLVGKIRLLTPRLPDTGWSLLAKSLLFLFLTRSRLWYPGLVTKERFLSSPLPFSLNPQFKMKCQCSWGTKSFVDVGSCSVRLSLLSLGSSSCAAAGHGVLLLWGSLGKLSLEDFALKSVQCHWDGLFP